METAVVCQQKGTIITSEVESSVLNEPIIHHIYLPPCYDPQSVKKYPLLILLHGQYGDNLMWIELGLTELADELMLNHEIPPFIIAFPFEKRFLIDWRDSKYDQALIKDFLPYLQENYAISSERDRLAIGGISRGANWAVRIGMTNPELFGSIGAHSFPSFGNEVYLMPAWVEEMNRVGNLRMYFDIGEKDIYKKYWDRFVTELQKYDFQFESHVYTGEHNSDYWQSHLEEYLLWYADVW
jgi:enterochelin esterase-like enzyme